MNAASDPTLSQAAFLALTEALSLAAVDRPGEDAFAPLHDFLAQTAPALPLARIADGFRLSRAETALLALLFAHSACAPVAHAVARADGVSGLGLPLWLAQHCITGLDATVLSPASALMRFGMFKPFPDPVPRIMVRLILADAVFDRLMGVAALDPEIAARFAPLPAGPQADAEGAILAAQLAKGFALRGPMGLPPAVVALSGDATELAQALRGLGLAPWLLHASDLPDDPELRDRLAARWSFHAALDAAALIVDSTAAPESVAHTGFVDRVFGHIVLTAAHPLVGLQRGVHILPPRPDGLPAAHARWQRALGPDRAARLGPGLGRIAAQFRLDPGGIATATARAAAQMDAAATAVEAERHLWHAAARAVPPAALPGVSILEPAFGWEDIVLPPASEAALRRIEQHVRHAATVFDSWGFAARMGGRETWRGRGVAVLFAGPSGTGKTMAAEVLASSLDLRVMAIDLSQIISKYVGETSKNIAAAFDEAERSGAVMVWNEGDAVWGVRGGVGNATDRHVNAEVGDLLQRIEGFCGFTIVTTNLRHAIDPAFLRRFRFIVDFPLPSSAERQRLWQNAFPPETPTEVLNWAALTALPLSGGSIRNVALGAAFIAASEGGKVTPAMVEAEVAEELRKQNLSVPRLNWEVGK